MYKKGSDHEPKKPVIISQMAAGISAQKWTRDNDHSTLYDRDGFIWSFSTKIKKHTYSERFELNTEISAVLNSKSLLESGTLDLNFDNRLIQLLNDQIIPCRLFKKSFLCATLNEAKKLKLSWISELEKEIHRKSFKKYRRDLIEKHINNACRYFSEL